MDYVSIMPGAEGVWLVVWQGAWTWGGWLVYKDVRQRSPYTRKSRYLWNWVASSLDRKGMTIVERGLCFSLSSETIHVAGCASLNDWRPGIFAVAVM